MAIFMCTLQRDSGTQRPRDRKHDQKHHQLSYAHKYVAYLVHISNVVSVNFCVEICQRAWPYTALCSYLFVVLLGYLPFCQTLQ